MARKATLYGRFMTTAQDHVSNSRKYLAEVSIVTGKIEDRTHEHMQPEMAVSSINILQEPYQPRLQQLASSAA
ncbi:hypothetical protein PM082_012398 [Marasmius tenuissimus]|nr:hypothetical protein PM082_012398 [Marasmius tenuissimus]